MLSTPLETHVGSPLLRGRIIPGNLSLINRAPAARLAAGESGMVASMATVKITITLRDTQVEEIRKRVAAKVAPSVSGFIQEAVQKSIENAAEFRAIVTQALQETGGQLRPKERAWARRMLSSRKRGAKAGKPRKVA